MSIRAYYELSCDRRACGVAWPAAITDLNSTTAQRVAAGLQGWHYDKVRGRDYCPEHRPTEEEMTR